MIPGGRARVASVRPHHYDNAPDTTKLEGFKTTASTPHNARMPTTPYLNNAEFAPYGSVPISSNLARTRRMENAPHGSAVLTHERPPQSGGREIARRIPQQLPQQRGRTSCSGPLSMRYLKAGWRSSMAEQWFCKPPVGGSIPLASSKPTFGWAGAKHRFFVLSPKSPQVRNSQGLNDRFPRIGSSHARLAGEVRLQIIWLS